MDQDRPHLRYVIPRDVYLCFTEDAAVFLDLKRDKYVGLSAGQTHNFRTLIGAEELTAAGPEKHLADSLIRQGLLKLDGEARAATPQTDLHCAEAPLVDTDIDSRAGVKADIRWHHVVNLVWAFLVSLLALRGRSLEHAVRRVQKRKEGRRRQPAFDVPLAANLIRIYFHLRPLLYSARGRCLLDSLTLIEFLARYKVFAAWVFGVRTAPFIAHCWVQQEHMLLNDVPARTKAYTPIMIA